MNRLEEYNKLIKKLKQARLEMGMDQETVAKQINCSQSYICRIEAGQRKIDVVLIIKLAKLYKKPISFFISD